MKIKEDTLWKVPNIGPATYCIGYILAINSLICNQKTVYSITAVASDFIS